MDVMLGDDAEGMRLDRFVRKMLGSIGRGRWSASSDGKNQT